MIDLVDPTADSFDDRCELDSLDGSFTHEDDDLPAGFPTTDLIGASLASQDLPRPSPPPAPPAQSHNQHISPLPVKNEPPRAAPPREASAAAVAAYAASLANPGAEADEDGVLA